MQNIYFRKLASELINIAQKTKSEDELNLIEKEFKRRLNKTKENIGNKSTSWVNRRIEKLSGHINQIISIKNLNFSSYDSDQILIKKENITFLKNDSLELLRKILSDPEANFRYGQWEAIDKVVNKKKKVLVIERTGWGKSIVYFLSTKLLRIKNSGPTIIISPLLSLMRNQVESANQMDINITRIDSTNEKEWDEIYNSISKNIVDAILISPERLSNEMFLENLLKISNKIGLLVVDEAHCISDWGHDFRPDYQRILSILKKMPRGMPILCTTATANKRVMDDISEQIGDLEVQRGGLMRKSLSLQTKEMLSKEERLSWLCQNLQKLNGTGLIYTRTVRDAEKVSEWLKLNGFNVEAYHSRVKDAFRNTTERREYLEDLLLNNQIKALVTTNALGMGYDKPDIHFVIHYQLPGSLVSYYQQVGRAGRKINNAFCFAMLGREDRKINEYFIYNAFPEENLINNLLNIISDYDGISLYNLADKLNVRIGKIEYALKYLSCQSPSPIFKDKKFWKKTPVNFYLDKKKINYLMNLRKGELEDMYSYIKEKKCLMQFIGNYLDDIDIEKCGKCQNCKKEELISTEIDENILEKARKFLKNSVEIILPRKQIPNSSIKEYNLKSNKTYYKDGRCLSRWDDGVWGTMVKQDKLKGRFREEILYQTIKMIKKWNPNPKPTLITYVPSRSKSDLVSSFCSNLAEQLGINFKHLIYKIKDNQPQKLQNNRFAQYRNLDGVFRINKDSLISDNSIFLIDDVIDSGATLHICSALLFNEGFTDIFPITLSDTSPI